MDLIIYHADCPDGFCSAFVAKKRFPEAELLSATYGQEPPFDAVYGRDVLVVDFSWPRQVVLELDLAARTLKILDHHKTAEAELKDLDFATFDMNRSGATLTWDYCFDGEYLEMGGLWNPELMFLNPAHKFLSDYYFMSSRRPWYVNYVEDRDLWRFQLPDSKEVNAFIMSLPHTIKAWTRLENMEWNEAAKLGHAIRLHIDHYIEKLVAQRTLGALDGYSVAVVNAPYPNISDVGHALCDHAEIGLGWFVRGDGMMQFSLRSRDGLDVAEIAKRRGGGGHRNASGFQVSLTEGRAILDSMFQPGAAGGGKE